MTDELTRTLQTLRQPTAAPQWADPARLRRAATQRRRRRAGLVTAIAAVCAAAVVVPLLTRGPSGPAYHGPFTVAARQGVAYELVGNIVSHGTAEPVDVSTAEQDLALKVLRAQLAGDDPNPVSSAMSLSIALSMLDLGARGETSQQITRLIGPSGASAQSIAAGWRDLMVDIAASALRSKIALDSANSIWQQRGFPLNRQFVDDLTTYLHSGVWQVDFTRHPDEAAAAVNAWVKSQTHGRITEVVSAREIHDWVLALVNAVYFKADWQTPFERTTNAYRFTKADGSTTTVDMVHGQVGAAVSTSPALTAVQLSYTGGRFAAVILEPQHQSLPAFAAALTASSLATMVRGLRTPLVRPEVRMPALHLRTSTPLKDTLKSLGMVRAFDPDTAQFDGVSPQPTFVAEAKQLATLDVTPRGTEAAAATVIGKKATSAPAPGPLVQIDRPYLFLIRDTQTGAILFSAAVQDPTRG